MMVLYATAVENLLKGIRVARGPSPAASGRLKPESLNHNLVAHAEKAGLRLTPDERRC
jgi:hypothetical protein